MPKNGRRAKPSAARDDLCFALVALLLIPAGLYLLIGLLVTKAGAAAEAERLGRDGVPVEALITAYDRGRKQSSTVWLRYEFAGRQHRVRVECDEPERCDPRVSRTMPIRVDPDRPGDLVTALGVTDDSTRLLNHWGWLTAAVALLGFGGGAAYFWWLFSRRT